MNKKQKVFLVVVFLLVMSPIAGMMMMNAYIPADNNILVNTPFGPVRSFGISADCAIDTTSTKITAATIDDTDNLYGGLYKTYTLVANTSFGTRGADIDNITIEFCITSTVYFSFIYDNDTEAVTEGANPTYVALGTYSNVTSGKYCNLTINFKVEWAHPDIDNVDVNVTAWNGVNSTESKKDANYDFDTDLSIASAGAICSTTVVGTNGEITIPSLTVYYEDSGGDNYPLAAQTDIWLTRTPATGGTDSWELTLDASAGTTTARTVTAGYIAQTETYTLNAYNQGTTSGDLMGATYADTVELSNSGGGGKSGIPAGSGLLGVFGDPQAMAVIGLCVIVGYFGYSMIVKGKVPFRSMNSGKRSSKSKGKKTNKRRKR